VHMDERERRLQTKVMSGLCGLMCERVLLSTYVYMSLHIRKETIITSSPYDSICLIVSLLISDICGILGETNKVPFSLLVLFFEVRI